MATQAIPYFRRNVKPTTIPSEPGDKFNTTYEVQIDNEGHKELVPVGKTNNYELIQSFKEECLIENILKAASMGDVSGLMAREGEYIDTTEMPKTLAEAQNAIIKIKTEFYKLSPEQREAFNNSPEQYVAAYGSELWADTMGYIKKEEILEEVPIEKPVVKEVAANE